MKATGLPVTVGTGGQTKYNRTRQQLPKTHWLDAANVGKATPDLTVLVSQPLSIQALGRGSRHVQLTDKYGFPRKDKNGKRVKARRLKRLHGFSTGDLVKLVMPAGKYAGTYIATLGGIRASGIFDIKTEKRKIGATYKHYQLLQHSSGYRCAHASKEGPI